MFKAKFKPYYIYRYVKYRLGNKSPLACVLKVTSRCNLKCLHCPWHKNIESDLPKEKWFEIVDQAKKRGCVLCIIEGGEPLLRRDLNSIIDYAKGKGMLVSVITNGTIDFSDISPDAVWVSVDGVRETYEKIRGFDFGKILENVKKNKNKNVIILMSISKTNAEDVEKVCGIFSSLANGIWFNFVYPYKGIKDNILEKNERSEIAKKIKDFKSRYNVINSDSYLKSVGVDWVCRPWLTLNVNSEGEFHKGCTVEQLEKCICEECDLSCYGELSQALKMKMDAIDFLEKSLGLKSDKVIFLKNER